MAVFDILDYAGFRVGSANIFSNDYAIEVDCICDCGKHAQLEGLDDLIARLLAARRRMAVDLNRGVPIRFEEYVKASLDAARSIGELARKGMDSEDQLEAMLEAFSEDDLAVIECALINSVPVYYDSAGNRLVGKHIIY